MLEVLKQRLLPAQRSLGVLILASWLLMALTQYLGQPWLEYARDKMGQGEWWRLWTAHYVHLNLIHLVMNLLAFAALVLLFEGILSWRHWLALLVILPPLISLGIWLVYPDVWRYAGLSAALHGGFAAGAILMLRSPGEAGRAVLLIALLLLKLLTEIQGGENGLTGALIGGHVLIQSHQLGALGGTLMGAVFFRKRQEGVVVAATKGLP